MKRINGIFIRSSACSHCRCRSWHKTRDSDGRGAGNKLRGPFRFAGGYRCRSTGDRRSDPRLLEVDAGMGVYGAQLGIGRRDLHVRLVAGLGLPCRPRLADCPDVWHRCRYRGKRVCRNRPDTMADLALHPQEKERGVGHGMGRAFRLPRCRRWIAYPASVAFRHPPAEAGAEKGS